MTERERLQVVIQEMQQRITASTERAVTQCVRNGVGLDERWLRLQGIIGLTGVMHDDYEPERQRLLAEWLRSFSDTDIPPGMKELAEAISGESGVPTGRNLDPTVVRRAVMVDDWSDAIQRRLFRASLGYMTSHVVLRTLEEADATIEVDRKAEHLCKAARLLAMLSALAYDTFGLELQERAMEAARREGLDAANEKIQERTKENRDRVLDYIRKKGLRQGRLTNRTFAQKVHDAMKADEETPIPFPQTIERYLFGNDGKHVKPTPSPDE